MLWLRGRANAGSEGEGEGEGGGGGEGEGEEAHAHEELQYVDMIRRVVVEGQVALSADIEQRLNAELLALRVRPWVLPTTTILNVKDEIRTNAHHVICDLFAKSTVA